MFKFEYDNQVSYDANFERWFVLNREEREEFNQDPYTLEKAGKVFHAMFKDILSHSIKVNAKGVLEEVLVLENEKTK
tara:strand:- start:250 stop:480 length:231 start_codon:yes stop_codon:yes gene_type:complete